MAEVLGDAEDAGSDDGISTSWQRGSLDDLDSEGYLPRPQPPGFLRQLIGGPALAIAAFAVSVLALRGVDLAGDVGALLSISGNSIVAELRTQDGVQIGLGVVGLWLAAAAYRASRRLPTGERPRWLDPLIGAALVVAVIAVVVYGLALVGSVHAHMSVGVQVAS